MAHVMPVVPVVAGLFFIARFGLGMVSNQARGGVSYVFRNKAGAYNLVACCVGVEFVYRISERIGVSVRTTA